jgi:hypothetical protein
MGEQAETQLKVVVPIEEEEPNSTSHCRPAYKNSYISHDNHIIFHNNPIIAEVTRRCVLDFLT